MIPRARVCLLLVLLAATLGPLLQGCRSASQAQAPIVVGIGNSTEQTVLGEITLLVLQRAGFRATARRGLGDAWSVRRALEGGRADLVWDYTGRAWDEALGHDQPIADAADLYRRVRDQDALNGFSWVDYAPAESRWVMAVPESWAAQARVRSLSDLAYHMQNLSPDLVLCTTAEVAASQYGPAALARVYRAQFKTPNVRQMTALEAIAGLSDGSCHCALVPANDIPAAVLDLRRLWDDKDLMPASNLAPVVRSFVLHNDPSLTPYLRRLAAALDQGRLAQLVAEVNNGRNPARVARQFMRSADVVSTPTPTLTPSPTPTRTATPVSQ
ncbi:MAG: glycine betaine ABC transporter substrate-binding protein [Anaerolineae bacterium]|jgi:osmoprotectant transport system substrate-binding protein